MSKANIIVLAVFLTGFLLPVFQGGEEVPTVLNKAYDNQDSAIPGFEEELEYLRQALKIPGMSAAVVKDQEILWAKGFGYADLENQVQASPETPYHLASVTKPIAATLLMQLVDEGMLSLDDPVSKYGLEVESMGEVLVRHLLTHTSEGVPGMHHEYNGNRYALLGAVIEGASGEPLGKLLSERILLPAGMQNAAPNPFASWGSEMETDFEVIKSLFGLGNPYSNFPHVYKNLARPYQFDAEFNIVPGLYNLGFSPAAGLMASVVDIARFDIALDQNELLPETTKNEMLEPVVSTYRNKTDLMYGLGWYTQQVDGTRLHWHAGRWPPSVSALYLKVPDQEITFIILANTDYLSTPYECLGDGDVLCSTFALAFFNAFVFPEVHGKTVPHVSWDSQEVGILSQLGQIQDPQVQEMLERELWSYRKVYASVGEQNLADRLEVIQRQVFRSSQLRRTPYISSIPGANPQPVLPGLGVWDLSIIYGIASIWLVLSLVSFLVLTIDLLRRRQLLRAAGLAWLLVVLVFGPLGLAIYFISGRVHQDQAGRRDNPSIWLDAMVSACFRAACYVLWVAVAIQLQMRFIQDTNPPVMIGLLYLLPLLVGVFILGSLLYRGRTGAGYWTSVRRSALGEFISITLLFIGVYLVLYLVFDAWGLSGFLVDPVIYWSVISLSGLAGFVLLLPFSYWMSRRRQPNWSAGLLSSAAAAERDDQFPEFQSARR